MLKCLCMVSKRNVWTWTSATTAAMTTAVMILMVQLTVSQESKGMGTRIDGRVDCNIWMLVHDADMEYFMFIQNDRNAPSCPGKLAAPLRKCVKGKTTMDSVHDEVSEHMPQLNILSLLKLGNPFIFDANGLLGRSSLWTQVISVEVASFDKLNFSEPVLSIDDTSGHVRLQSPKKIAQLAMAEPNSFCQEGDAIWNLRILSLALHARDKSKHYGGLPLCCLDHDAVKQSPHECGVTCH
eukprot:Plantae.Rhodophyta-Purpureofilum_apyrenoidigerum.ctg4833.p2 GENE.Plantae.Rhodophyta-Purpureofilum_apyrenoidigerum.ctg4833~~Plantae.Rhodophyta-Purpureofilum_apyrenoidigerum.ctg4833.p2  ORF type:complete len:239 (+),score=29.47 Plantae.Rhodophyta-Purpureofilum_apyrenoidigerum.ctg4833:201-917(+)